MGVDVIEKLNHGDVQSFIRHEHGQEISSSCIWCLNIAPGVYVAPLNSAVAAKNGDSNKVKGIKLCVTQETVKQIKNNHQQHIKDRY